MGIKRQVWIFQFDLILVLDLAFALALVLILDLALVLILNLAFAFALNLALVLILDLVLVSFSLLHCREHTKYTFGLVCLLDLAKTNELVLKKVSQKKNGALLFLLFQKYLGEGHVSISRCQRKWLRAIIRRIFQVPEDLHLGVMYRVWSKIYFERKCAKRKVFHYSASFLSIPRVICRIHWLACC